MSGKGTEIKALNGIPAVYHSGEREGNNLSAATNFDQLWLNMFNQIKTHLEQIVERKLNIYKDKNFENLLIAINFPIIVPSLKTFPGEQMVRSEKILKILKIIICLIIFQITLISFY